jgi:hypothetical protein
MSGPIGSNITYNLFESQIDELYAINFLESVSSLVKDIEYRSYYFNVKRLFCPEDGCSRFPLKMTTICYATRYETVIFIGTTGRTSNLHA